MDVDWMNWKTWATVGVILLVAFAIYAFASTRDEAADSAVPARPAPVVAHPTRLTQAAPGVGVIHTEWLESQSGTYKSERNLFAYKEPPPPPPPKIVAPPPVIAPPPQPPPQPTEPPKPVPPQFPYHYIGTFGTAANPIATFSGNGQIVNVRVGQTIDGKFILRSIGIESVEISYVGFPPDLTTRIPIGQ
ncbi:MAG TPA: hypothetical protein VI391_05575 [Thermoanaerobaculia bacterium]